MEIEPDHAACTPARLELARLDLEHRLLVGHFGELAKGLLHRRIGLGPQRAMVELGQLQCAAAVVRAIVDVDHIHALVEQIDGRQDAVAVQAVGVEAIGREVGGGDKAHAVVEQRQQQAVEDHRIGDVRHMELIKADELVLLGDPGAQHIERVLRALEQGQLALHLAHELMEMQTHLAAQWHGIEKAIHDEALAAPHPAVHVDPARNVGVVDQLLDRVRALVLVLLPGIGTALQGLHRTHLCRITLKTLGLEFGLVCISYRCTHGCLNLLLL